MSETDDSTFSTGSLSRNVTRLRPPKARTPKEPMTDYDDAASRKNVKMPPFSPEDPDIWFALLESQFENLNITADAVKFATVLQNIDLKYTKCVKDVLLNPPAENRYGKLKRELIRRLCASQEQKVKQLLTHEQLGDRRPSQFLRHLQDLAGPAVPADFVRSIWSSRLPKSVQTILASQTTQTLEQQADLADRIQDIAAPCSVAAASANNTLPPPPPPSKEIAELRLMVKQLAMKVDEFTRTPRSDSRSRTTQRRASSTSRQRSRSKSSYEKYPVCWYHQKYGPQAHNCTKPCDFKAGNFPGSL